MSYNCKNPVNQFTEMETQMYRKPECEVVYLRTEAPLLTGSNEGWGEEVLPYA